RNFPFWVELRFKGLLPRSSLGLEPFRGGGERVPEFDRYRLPIAVGRPRR
ncbi:unnamed protein product, partial [Staurois parvus]